MGFVCVQSLLAKYISNYPSVNFQYDLQGCYSENHATGRKTQVMVRNIDKLVSGMVTET